MGMPQLGAPEGVDAQDWATALNAVRDYCGWHIAPPITETIILDGPGGSLLTLPSLRVTAISEVKVEGRTIADPEWSADGMVRGSWPTKFRSVEVTLTHGFDELPDEVHAVAHSLALTGAVPAGLRSDQAGPFQVAMGTSGAGQSGASATTAAGHPHVLDRYRLRHRP